MSLQREHRLTLFLYGAYLILALFFSLGPIFEGPDEIEHYRYIRSIATQGTLPNLQGQPRGEFHQAPLYYLLAAPLDSLLKDSDFARIDQSKNPFYGWLVYLPGNDNKNLYLHARAENFPFTNSETALSVHIIRLVSIALGLGTVITSRAIFRLLWPDNPVQRLFALAFVVFWPQFLYISSTINNDNVLIFLATLCLWLLLKQAQDGPSRRLAIWLGIALGGVFLSKVSGFFIIFPVGAAFVLDRRWWRFVPGVMVITLIVGGWWYARNWILYNDPLALQAWLHTWGADAIRNGELSPDIAVLRIPYAYQSLWARFGQGAVSVGSEVYRFFDVVVFASLAGIALRLIRLSSELLRKHYPTNPAFRQGVLLTVFTLSWAGALFSLSSSGWSANQGRYLLSGVTGWSALIALGVSTWFPRRVFKPAVLISTIALGAVAILSLFAYDLPSYQIDPASAKMDRELSYTYENYAQLIGMSPAYPKVQPGETLTITLYWRALKPTPTRLQVYLHTTDTLIVRRDSHPATGNLLSTDWQPGEQWAENYRIVIPDNAPPQTIDTLVVGLYDPLTHDNLPAINADGKEVTPIIGTLAVNGLPGSLPDIAYRFGSSIALSTPQLTLKDQQLQICLTWQALQDQTTDYNIFLHIFNAGGEVVKLQDSLLGTKYPSGAWRTGEVVKDCVTLELATQPASGWKLTLGLYPLATQDRLTVTDAQGTSLPNSEVSLPLE